MSVEKMTSQPEVRAAFWRDFTGGKTKPRKWYGKSQNQLPCDVRVAWAEWVDFQQKSGALSEELASRVTL